MGVVAQANCSTAPCMRDDQYSLSKDMREPALACAGQVQNATALEAALKRPPDMGLITVCNHTRQAAAAPHVPVCACMGPTTECASDEEL